VLFCPRQLEIRRGSIRYRIEHVYGFLEPQPLDRCSNPRCGRTASFAYSLVILNIYFRMPSCAEVLLDPETPRWIEVVKLAKLYLGDRQSRCGSLACELVMEERNYATAKNSLPFEVLHEEVYEDLYHEIQERRCERGIKKSRARKNLPPRYRRFSHAVMRRR